MTLRWCSLSLSLSVDLVPLSPVWHALILSLIGSSGSCQHTFSCHSSSMVSDSRRFVSQMIMFLMVFKMWCCKSHKGPFGVQIAKMSQREAMCVFSPDYRPDFPRRRRWTFVLKRDFDEPSRTLFHKLCKHELSCVFVCNVRVCNVYVEGCVFVVLWKTGLCGLEISMTM